MAYAISDDRVVITVTVSEKEQAAVVKKRLEETGIIYSEGDGKFRFSVIPQLRMEDWHRAKEILQSVSP